MDNTRRRAYIKEKLEQAEHRLRGADLANECGVSRQVIVGDMALFRAEGMDIISTPRGYYLNKEKKRLPSHSRLPPRPAGDREGTHRHRSGRRHHP